MSHPFKRSYPTRAAALKAARAFISLLKNPQGWKPRLHCSEPLREHRKHAVWYMCIVSGPMALHYSVRGSVVTFWTLLASREEWVGLGDPRWFVDGSFRNPDTAIAAQIKVARAVFAQEQLTANHLNKMLDSI